MGLEGARVCVSSRSRERVEGDVEKLVESCIDALGGLDILVYNTGGPRPGRFTEVSLEDWEYAVRLLLLSAVRVTRYALPHLYRRRRASIVYVTSVAIREPIPDLILPNTVHIPLDGLVKSLTRELGGSGIRVNAVLRGPREPRGYWRSPKAAPRRKACRSRRF